MQRPDKISVTMPPDMMRAVRESVESGEYASTNDAVRDAVRVWQRERAQRATRLDAIKDRVHRSISDPRRDVSDEEFDARLKALIGEDARDD
ncbi:type II toxin-antitoxin system ParD family antitoxin [Salinarimonas sp.]|uniref:ribbon-helix-helix domain-containing protein n=1 Tax=Salinarimonas sp. TaxID=2766526 RepID=UPI003918A52B